MVKNKKWENLKSNRRWIILEKSKYDIHPKWKKEKFQTGGKVFYDFKEAQIFKKKLNSMSSSIDYKVIKDTR